MRFKLRSVFILFTLLAVSIAIAEWSTREVRHRYRLQSELFEMGAVNVSFDEYNSPDWISFSITNINESFAQLEHVKDVWLDDAKLTDPGMANLASIDSIGCLHITNCNISAAQLKLLSKIGSLEILRLNGSTVSDNSIDSIAELKSLIGVDLSGTMVSDEGVKKLREKRPELNIRHEN